jgi:hypothetical protein
MSWRSPASPKKPGFLWDLNSIVHRAKSLAATSTLGKSPVIFEFWKSRLNLTKW